MINDITPVNEPSPDAAGARPLSPADRVAAAAQRWYETLLSSGGSLDQLTLAYVFGTHASRATLELLDACFDVEHQRARPVS